MRSDDPRIDAILRLGLPDGIPAALLEEKRPLAVSLLAAADAVDPLRRVLADTKAALADAQQLAANLRETADALLASSEQAWQEYRTEVEYRERADLFASAAHHRADAAEAQLEQLRTENERVSAAWADAIQQQQLADNAHLYDIQAAEAALVAARTQLEEVCAENEGLGRAHNELLRLQDELAAARTGAGASTPSTPEDK